MKKLTIIACVDQVGLIGLDGVIPWHSPEDLSHFKRYTLGKTVLMGSKTFYSLPSPLDYRTNVVISSDVDKFDKYIESMILEYGSTGKTLPVICFAASLDEFFSADLTSFGDELVCIGGGAMYSSLMPYATDMIITKINTLIKVSDKSEQVYFPPIDSSWKLVKKEDLISSIGTNVGEIMYLKSDRTYSNVFSFQTSQPLEVEDYYCAMNNIGSVFSKDIPIYSEEPDDK
jgi:dihydrofolate reductase